KSRTRAAACTMLCYLCSDEPELLAPYITDHRWYVARNAVFILGQIGGAEVAPILALASEHPEPRVRRQVVAALGNVPRDLRAPAPAQPRLAEGLPSGSEAARLACQEALATRKAA